MSATPIEHALLAGQTALERGAYADAADAFRLVREALPHDVTVALMLANALRLADDPLGARSVLETAEATGDWTAPATAHQLAGALLDAGAPFAALRCAEYVRQRLPTDPAALGAVAAARRMVGDAEGAWPLVERAVRLAPREPSLLLTAAQVRHDLRDLPGAERFLTRADTARPGHGPTQVQRAYTSLLRAPSEAGWALFEARPLPVPPTRARPWHGEPLTGQSVLVTAEQGVGDQFQFLRFVAALRDRGAGRVVVECHRDAVSLLMANGYEALPRGSTIETDWHVPMMSLPHRLGTGAALLGDRVPYLTATRRVALPADGRPNIGLVWAGNPAFPGGVTRDLDPTLLPELVATPDIRWWSLQQGPAGASLVPGLTAAPSPGSWEDTAALLASLDGLVTTDTGIAHLAGAMGVRTWVMLQYVPDWRWGLEHPQTPWYPSVQLVRPRRWNDWRSVVAGVQQALASLSSDAPPASLP
jgi:hypothetical protein